MVRHTNDNDKKPRARQDGRSPGPFKSSGPRKSGDGKTPFGDKPRKAFAGKPGDDRPRAGAKPAKAEAAPVRSERIAKAMARAGIASRREVERLIGLGKVDPRENLHRARGRRREGWRSVGENGKRQGRPDKEHSREETGILHGQLI